MGIADLLRHAPSEGIFPGATPAMNPLGVAQEAGVRQDTKTKGLEYLMKQLEYSEALDDADIAAYERKLKEGGLKFDLEHQPERLKRNKVQEDIDAEMKLDEQLLRGINDPKTYKRWSDAGVLPRDFYDQNGNPLSYDASAKQRVDMYQRGVMNAEQYRKERLASIQASANTEGFGAVPTTYQDRAGLRSTRKIISDTGMKIGDPTDTESDSDALALRTAITELSTKLAAQKARLGGKVANEQQIRERLGQIAFESKAKNPVNEDAWGPMKWAYTDEIINWNKFNESVANEFGVDSKYFGPSAELSLRIPAFMLAPNGTRVTKEQIEATATKHKKSVEEVINDLGLIPQE